MAIIKNLTPHPIFLVDKNNDIIRTFGSNGIVRLKAETVGAGQIDKCPVTRTQFGAAEGLPKQENQVVFSACSSCGKDYYDGHNDDYCSGCGSLLNHTYGPAIYYIVSQLVKTANSDRKDLLVPAEVVRDNNGSIIGCRSFGI